MHPPRFLQTILTCPHDDAPRLEYADWLDRSNDPLGEFIRLQCLLARQPVSEPCIVHERREQALLGDFQREWSRLIKPCVNWCSFRRGFIEEISLTEQQLMRHGTELFRLAPVVDIHLTSDGHRLDKLPELPEVCYPLFLDLSAQPIGNEGAERLAESPLLARVCGLNLGCCYLGDAGLDALIDSADLDSLRELYLNDNPVSDESIRRFVLTPLVEQLHWLDVRRTEISEEGIEVLKRVLGDRCLA